MQGLDDSREELVIQRAPRGLLDLLSLKGGSTPHTLELALGGSLEMLPFYLVDRQETVLTSTNTLTGPGFFQAAAAGEVPEGEMWILTNLTAVSNALAAAQSLRGRLAIRRTADDRWDVASSDAQESVTGAQLVTGWDCYKWLRARDRIGFYCAQVTGYASGMTLCATLYRLKV